MAGTQRGSRPQSPLRTLSVPGLHPPSSSRSLLGGRLFWQEGREGWLFRGEKGQFRLFWRPPPPKHCMHATGMHGGTAGPRDALPRDTTLMLTRKTLQTVPAKAPESRLPAELLAPSPDGLLGSEEGCERSPLYLHYQECKKQGGAGWGGVLADCSQDPLVRNPPCSVSVS